MEERNEILTQNLQTLSIENEDYKMQLQKIMQNNNNKRDFSCCVQDEWAAMIEKMKNDLYNANLEITEYEEQTKSYLQKIRILERQVELLNDEKLKLSDDKDECCNRIRGQFQSLIKEKQMAIENLQQEIRKVRDSEAKLKMANKDMERKLKEMAEEKAVLLKEMDELTKQTKKQIRQIQQRLNDLEQQDNAKDIKLADTCRALCNIRETVENDKQAQKSYMEKLKMVESKNRLLENEQRKLLKENEQLRNSVQDKYKDCDCEGNEDNVGELRSNLQSEINKLRGELCQKQCTIFKLEQCIDNSNQILGECEKEIKEMHCQNECVQRQCASLQKHLENKLYEVDIHKADKEMLKKKTAN